MKTKVHQRRKLITCILATVMSFCIFSLPVKASVKDEELLMWSSALKGMVGCKYDFYNDALSFHSLSNEHISKIKEYLDNNQLSYAYEYLGDLYMDNDHTSQNWKAIYCAKMQLGGTFSNMLDTYVASYTASVLDYETDNWWLLGETIMIIVVGTGIVFYVKKKRSQQKS